MLLDQHNDFLKCPPTSMVFQLWTSSVVNAIYPTGMEWGDGIQDDYGPYTRHLRMLWFWFLWLSVVLASNSYFHGQTRPQVSSLEGWLTPLSERPVVTTMVQHVTSEDCCNPNLKEMFEDFNAHLTDRLNDTNFVLPGNDIFFTIQTTSMTSPCSRKPLMGACQTGTCCLMME